jgi:biotin carboxyl carrier protein
MKIFTSINDESFDIDINIDTQIDEGFLASVNGRQVKLRIIEAKQTSLTLSIDGHVGFYEFNREKGRLVEVIHANRSFRSELKNPQQDKLEKLLEAMGAGLGGGSAETNVLAQMPGKVLGVMIKRGEKVELGQIVIVLEAMKMENEISSVCEGLVRKVNVKVGDTVATGDIMVEVDPQ